MGEEARCGDWHHDTLSQEPVLDAMAVDFAVEGKSNHDSLGLLKGAQSARDLELQLTHAPQGVRVVVGNDSSPVSVRGTAGVDAEPGLAAALVDPARRTGRQDSGSTRRRCLDVVPRVDVVRVELHQRIVGARQRVRGLVELDGRELPSPGGEVQDPHVDRVRRPTPGHKLARGQLTPARTDSCGGDQESGQQLPRWRLPC